MLTALTQAYTSDISTASSERGHIHIMLRVALRLNTCNGGKLELYQTRPVYQLAMVARY